MRRFIALGIWVLSAGLASLPAQEFAGVRQISGRGIYCRATGTGNPLVVVHGGPGLAHDYLFAPFSRLAKRTPARLLRPDGKRPFRWLPAE